MIDYLFFFFFFFSLPLHYIILLIPSSHSTESTTATLPRKILSPEYPNHCLWQKAGKNGSEQNSFSSLEIPDTWEVGHKSLLIGGCSWYGKRNRTESLMELPTFCSSKIPQVTCSVSSWGPRCGLWRYVSRKFTEIISWPVIVDCFVVSIVQTSVRVDQST